QAVIESGAQGVGDLRADHVLILEVDELARGGDGVEELRAARLSSARSERVGQLAVDAGGGDPPMHGEHRRLPRRGAGPRRGGGRAGGVGGGGGGRERGGGGVLFAAWGESPGVQPSRTVTLPSGRGVRFRAGAMMVVPAASRLSAHRRRKRSSRS